MGLIQRQSIINTLMTFVGFGIGALNALFLYTRILGDDYYGLTAFILSAANLMMPLMAFGVQNTLIKYYPMQADEAGRSQLMNFSLLLPLLISLPLFLIAFIGYDFWADLLSKENPIIADYFWLIPVVGLLMAYFELFYAWVKVEHRSVGGNFIKEVVLRLLVSIGLLLVYFGWLSTPGFVYALALFYGLSTLFMAGMAFRIRKPEWGAGLPKERQMLWQFSAFIVLSTGIAVMLLDLDKFMIGQFIPIQEAAYYSVAAFIAITVSVPLRAMHQIIHPITTSLMAHAKWDELQSLYQKSAISLTVVGGWLLLGIWINLDQVYALLPEAYAVGKPVVYLIGLSKFIDLMLGNNNSIVFNSDYYRWVLMMGVGLVGLSISLNIFLIPRYGIEGAAWATLISVGLYSLGKLYFVVRKMHLFPFGLHTWKALGWLMICYVLFAYWQLPFHPIVGILIKSAMFSLIYWGGVYFLKLSEEVNALLRKGKFF